MSNWALVRSSIMARQASRFAILQVTFTPAKAGACYTTKSYVSPEKNVAHLIDSLYWSHPIKGEWLLPRRWGVLTLT